MAKKKQLPDTQTEVTARLQPPLLREAAQHVLQQNDKGNFTMPAHGLYSHQWLWDSCFIAIGQRHYDVHRAQAEILSLLRGQWQNGMIPHMILDADAVNTKNEPVYHAHDRIWRSWLNPNSPDHVSTSGITQPPMLAEAITRIGACLSMNEARAWYKHVFPALLSYHEWLYAERDPHKEGLVVQVHPWETGLDNTPPWMEALQEHALPHWIRFMHATKLDTVVGLFRSDKQFVGKNERVTNVEALALYSLQRRLRRKGYNFNTYIDHTLFVIEDLSFNCIFIRANSLLRQIAETIDQPLPEVLHNRMLKSEAALEQLWDEASSEYYSRDFISHRLLTESTVATLLPLYAGCIPKAKAKRLVALLENEHRFGPAYPVPSTPLDSPWFSSRRYWQGPTWLNMNWLIIDGLRRYGFHDHAAALRESSLELVSQSGFFEYFDPLTGEGAGTDNFSWTAALALDLDAEPTI